MDNTSPSGFAASLKSHRRAPPSGTGFHFSGISLNVHETITCPEHHNTNLLLELAIKNFLQE